MGLKFVIALVALNVISITSGTQFTLCVRDLPLTDAEDGAPDTYVKIYYAPSKGATALEFIGQTHVNANNRNPDWAPIYTVPDNGDDTQYLKFTIYDADGPESEDEFIGEISITLVKVLAQSDRVVWTDIRNNGAWEGSLVIKVQKEVAAEDCRSITCAEDPEDMYFPHPGRCNAFCQCSNGTPVEMPCPIGLVFNPALNVCVSPDSYACPNNLKVVPY